VRIDVFLRDPNYNIIAQVEDFAKLTVIARFNDVGSFLLEGADVGDAAQYYAEGYGVVIYRNGVFLLSGLFASLDFNGTEDQDLFSGGGLDDNVVIRDALAFPEPFGNFSSQAYDIRSGAAESIVYQYVDVNLGPGSDPVRRKGGFSLATDLGRGSVVNEQARFENLMDLINGILIKGGDTLGWRVVQTVAGGLQFQVYECADRSATAIFSRELGNLQTFEYSRDAPTQNHIVCGGSGEDVARVFRQGSDATSIATWNRRIEVFRDRRDTDDILTLDQTIDEELSTGADKTGLKLNPIDTDSVAFKTDYDLGDIVTVEVKGVEIQEKIREIQLTYTPDGAETIEPVVSTPGNFNVSTTFGALRDARVRELRRALSRLERR